MHLFFIALLLISVHNSIKVLKKGLKTDLNLKRASQFFLFLFIYSSIFLDYEREPCRFPCKRVWPDDQPSSSSPWCFTRCNILLSESWHMVLGSCNVKSFNCALDN